jgi:iron complex outermembrane receptor protein
MKTQLLAGAAALALVPSALASDLEPLIEAPIEVRGRALSGPAAEAAADAARQPGNISVVDSESYADRYAIGFTDTLAFTPGVIAQTRAGEESRLIVRGSGLYSNIHMRGVRLMFNGLPITNADGFGDFQEIDPLVVSHMAVHRGANGFSLGSSMVGGALEITGLNARGLSTPGEVRAEGGSFGASRLHGRHGEAGERFDYVVAGTWTRQDGYRDNAEQSNGRVYADMGWRWTDRVETRVGVLGNDVNQMLPGSVTRQQALSDPRRAAPASVEGRHARDLNAWRGWTSTRFDMGAAGELLIGGGWTTRSLWHPVPVLVDQDLTASHLSALWTGQASAGGMPVEWRLGGGYQRSRTDARVFVNIAGDAGPQIGDALQKAGVLTGFGEVRVTPVPQLDLIAGVTAIDTDRRVNDRLAPSAGGDVSFSDLAPRVGAVWRAAYGLTAFANASGVYEPPAFNELTQGGVGGFTPIEAQEGLSLEAGLRGAGPRLAWEVAVFQINLENEFAAFTEIPGIPAATFNAGDTIRRGVEAGVEALAYDGPEGAVRPRLSWTYGEYRFDGDPIYGTNRLPGAPRHQVRAELGFELGDVRLAPNVSWRSGDAFVDYANTVAAPGYTLWGLNASWQATERANLYVEARNLFDRAHIATVSTVADAATASPAIYTPGEGRAVYAGLRFGFGAVR